MRTVTTWPLLIIALLGATATHAQQGPPFRCGTGDPSLSGGRTPEEQAAMEAANAELEEFTRRFIGTHAPGGREPYIIPVVFHIIHDNGQENISDAQVHDAIRALNDDFNKRNADWPNVKPEFLSLVADVGVEFRLARKDPNGNCTRGIVRVRSTLTNSGDQAMKNLSRWPRERYMNLWTCIVAGGTGIAGYTMRPPNAGAASDGIVMRHDHIGTIGTGSPGRAPTFSHEVGHWINLSHTWGDTNSPGDPANCGTDDGVADTPNTIGWTSCNLYGSSCGSPLDNVENFMEYTGCRKMFTNGQAARMIAALNAPTAQRNQLWSPENLAFTGVDGTPLLCVADFTSDTRMTCAGGSISFTDRSYHDVTTRHWEFPGGTPATSTDPNPVVTYAQPGTYTVTLTVGDGSTTVSTTRQDHILVLSAPGVPVPFDEGFEGHADLASSPWTVVDPDNNNTFELTDAAAFSGNNSVRVQNIPGMNGQVDELVSETIDMSGEQSARVSYRYAYARRSANNDDRLRISVSNDCGATWSTRQQLRGSLTLNTAGAPVTGDFVPSGQEQWMYGEVTNITSAYFVGDFRLRFEFESAGGNNLYIDDININGSPVGIGERAPGNGGALTVVPNPVEGGRAQALFGMAQAGQARIELLDVLGRRLAVLHDGRLAAGPQRVELPVDILQGGLYFVQLRQGTRNEAVRFAVE